MIRKHLFIVLGLALCGALLPAFPASAAEWKTSMDGVFERSKTENKPVLVFVYHPVTLREALPVWDNPLVIKAVASFITVRLDLEQAAEFVTKYHVNNFPAVLFFDPQGREIFTLRMEDNAMQEDILKRTVLFKRINDVQDEIQRFSLVESQLQKIKDDPKMISLYAKGLQDRSLFDQAEEQYARLFSWPNLDPKILKEIEQNYILMFFTRATFEFYTSQFARCIDTMQRFLKRYPKNDAVPQADLLLGMALYESGNRKEGERILRDMMKDKQANPALQNRARTYLEEKKGSAS